jgi:hypothetical protein
MGALAGRLIDFELFVIGFRIRLGGVVVAETAPLL